MKRVAAVVVLGAVLLALPECRDPTEITVRITSDACATLDSTAIIVGSFGTYDTHTFSAVQAGCLGDGYVGSIVVVPSGSLDEKIGIKVIAGIGKDPATCMRGDPKCIVARRALGFVQHTPLTVPIALETSCAGVVCDDPSTTCVKGNCVPAAVDPQKCPSGDCFDAGVRDAAPDSGPSACLCTRVAPMGWSGPVAFVTAGGGATPSCGGAYTMAGPTGHSGLVSPQTMCGCSCPSSATGTTCGSVTLNLFSDTNCNMGSGSTTLPTNNQCVNFNLAGSVKADAGKPKGLGTCGAATPSKTIPPTSWTSSHAVCGYFETPKNGDCAAGELCLQSTPMGAAPKPCVFQSGDVACPGAPYTVKTSVATGITDTRDCTACTCTPAGGACAASVLGHAGVGCNGGGVGPFQANLTCSAQGANLVSASASQPSVTPASCNPTGAQATGSAVEAMPFTVCCQP